MKHRPIAASLIAAMVLASCDKGSNPSDGSEQATAAAASSVNAPTASASASPAVSTETSRRAPFIRKAPPKPLPLAPFVVDPKVPPFEMGMMDHATVFGWAADSSELASCFTDGGLGAFHCQFAKPGGSIESLQDHVREAPSASLKARIDARLAKQFKVRDANWRYGSELTVSWRTIPPEEPGDKPVPGVFELQARVKGDQQAVTVDRIVSKVDWGAIHPDAIAVSPNGEHLGVVTHAFAGEFSDTFQLKIWSVDEYARSAFNTAGFEHHRAGRYERAAELFHRAAFIDEKAVKPMYNLACALARLGEPAAERALEAAIARGGAQIAKKAQADADFASVANSAWFKALTSKGN